MEKRGAHTSCFTLLQYDIRVMDSVGRQRLLGIMHILNSFEGHKSGPYLYLSPSIPLIQLRRLGISWGSRVRVTQQGLNWVWVKLQRDNRETREIGMSERMGVDGRGDGSSEEEVCHLRRFSVHCLLSVIFTDHFRYFHRPFLTTATWSSHRAMNTTHRTATQSKSQYTAIKRGG